MDKQLLEPGTYSVMIVDCFVRESKHMGVLRVTRFAVEGRSEPYFEEVERVVPWAEPTFQPDEQMMLKLERRETRAGRTFHVYKWFRA